MYISTKGDEERIDVPVLLKRLEQFGVVKASYFKEKQNFGFVQFLDASVCLTYVITTNWVLRLLIKHFTQVVDVVIDNISKISITEGVTLIGICMGA